MSFEERNGTKDAILKSENVYGLIISKIQKTYKQLVTFKSETTRRNIKYVRILK